MNRFLELVDELDRYNTPISSSLTSTSTKQQVLEKARKEARFRVQKAYLHLNGTHPTHGQRWRQEGLMKARRLISKSISDIDDVVDVLETMHTVLSSSQRFTTQFNKAHCALRGAYYDSRDSKVHLCPPFYKKTSEEQIRTMIHEAAHAAGIGQSKGESYLLSYDCKTSYNDINVADGWAHFVHCVLDLPADPPIMGSGSRHANPGSAQKKGGKSQAKGYNYMARERGYENGDSRTYPYNEYGYEQGLASLFEEPYAQEFQATPDWCQIKFGIIKSATEIQGDWLKTGGGMFEESDGVAGGALTGEIGKMLTMFWKATGMSDAAAKKKALVSAQDGKHGAWSAAFISWCVRNAMPAPPPPHHGGFVYSGLHMVYIANCMYNRAMAEANPGVVDQRPFHFFDINDSNIIPRAGDILCLNRKPKGKPWTKHNFKDIKKKWSTKPNNVSGSSHCDIVIGFNNEGGTRILETVGGNVGNTVNSRYYTLDSNGRLLNQVNINNTKTKHKDVTKRSAKRDNQMLVFGLIRLTSCSES